MYCKAKVIFENSLSKFCSKPVRTVKGTNTNTFTCRLSAWVIFIILFTGVVYHLPQIPGNSGWDVNGKRCFDSSHWKIPGTNGNSEKVAPFSRLGRSEWKFVYHLQVSWVWYWFHVVTRIQSSAVPRSGNFRQMVNDTCRSYQPKIPG